MKPIYITIASFLMLVAGRPLSAQTWNKNAPAKTTLSMLQGSWFGKESDNAIFSIEGDTLTYIDSFKKFKILILKDTFDIQTTESHYNQVILKLTHDSLIVRNLPNKKEDAMLMEDAAGGKIVKYWKNN